MIRDGPRQGPQLDSRRSGGAITRTLGPATPMTPPVTAGPFSLSARAAASAHCADGRGFGSAIKDDAAVRPNCRAIRLSSVLNDVLALTLC